MPALLPAALAGVLALGLAAGASAAPARAATGTAATGTAKAGTAKAAASPSLPAVYPAPQQMTSHGAPVPLGSSRTAPGR